MWAILRRDLLTAIRYRTGFAIGAVGALVEMAAFYFLARAVGPGFRPDGIEYYPFLLVGTGLYAFLVMGISSFLSTVQEAQQNGTLEVLVTTATPPAALVFLSALSSFAGKIVTLIFYVVGGLLLFRVPVYRPNLAGCLVIFVLSVGIAASIGVVAAALQLSVQKGSAIVWLLGSGVWFLTGTMFPVAALPSVLRGVSKLIPLTYALDGMRLALLRGAPFSILNREIAILGVFCAVMLPLSLLFFSYALRQARRNGTLSFY